MSGTGSGSDETHNRAAQHQNDSERIAGSAIAKDSPAIRDLNAVLLATEGESSKTGVESVEYQNPEPVNTAGGAQRRLFVKAPDGSFVECGEGLPSGHTPNGRTSIRLVRPSGRRRVNGITARASLATGAFGLGVAALVRFYDGTVFEMLLSAALIQLALPCGIAAIVLAALSVRDDSRSVVLGGIGLVLGIGATGLSLAGL